MERRSLIKLLIGTSGTAFSCNRWLPTVTPTDPMTALTDQTQSLPPLPPEEYTERLEKLRDNMARSGVSVYLAEAGSTLEYFTGITWGRSERLFATVIGLHNPPIVLCPRFEADRAQEQNRLQLEIRPWEEHADPGRLLAQCVTEAGASQGAVALEPTTRHFVVEALRRQRPIDDLGHGRSLTDACRMIKSAAELERMSLADQITKAAYQVALEGLRENLTEGELAEKVASAHRLQGAAGGAMVLFGPNSALPHGSTVERRLRMGDVVLMDGGCRVQRYQSDVTRTVVLGRPSPLQEKVWRLVLRAQRAAIEAIRPGVECGDIDRVARQVIGEGGYGFGYESFTHRLGHGIGLDGHEPPYLVPGSRQRLEPGMTFSVEPGIYLGRELGVRHEDIVVVTDDGCEVLGDRVDPDTIGVG